MQYVERTIISQDWVTLLLLACFVLLAVISVFYRKRFEDFIKLPVSHTYFISKGISEEIKHPFNLILFSIQIISISLFIYLFFPEASQLETDLFIQIGIGVFVFIAVKYLIEKLIGSIFSIEELVDQYVFQKFSYKNYFSLVLFAINLVFYFTYKPSITILLIITGILLTLNFLIVFYRFKNYRTLLFNNFFYFLLYLCTLEISPYLIVYKALS